MGLSAGSPGVSENGAVHVEQPAVVAAPDAALGDDPVLQRRTAMAAMLVQETDPPGEVPEQHQLLAEHLDQHGTLPELLGHRHRHPEAPQVLAARGARSRCGSAPDPRARPRRGGIRCSEGQADRRSWSCRRPVAAANARGPVIPLHESASRGDPCVAPSGPADSQGDTCVAPVPCLWAGLIVCMKMNHRILISHDARCVNAKGSG